MRQQLDDADPGGVDLHAVLGAPDGHEFAALANEEWRQAVFRNQINTFALSQQGEGGTHVAVVLAFRTRFTVTDRGERPGDQQQEDPEAGPFQDTPAFFQGGQGVGDSPGAPKSVIRVPAQAALGHPANSPTDATSLGHGPDRPAFPVRVIVQTLFIERPAPGQQFEKDHPQRPDIGPRADRANRGIDLLRGHVRQRPGPAAVGGQSLGGGRPRVFGGFGCRKGGKTKVRHQWFVGRVEQDVARLEVAMQHSLIMGMLNAGDDLRQQPDRFLRTLLDEP